MNPQKNMQKLIETNETNFRKQLPVEAEQLREVAGCFGTGVTIVTMKTHDWYHGMTVSAFCSLSLTPPLILVCINQQGLSHTLLQQTKSFAVNILAEDSAWIAQQFASARGNKFDSIPFSSGVTGAPLLKNMLATLECLVYETFPGGDHSILVGKVIAIAINSNRRPLLYYKSGFQRLPIDCF